MENEDIIDILCEIRINTALDTRIQENENYKKAVKAVNKKNERLLNKDFTDKQKLAIDRLVSEYNYIGVEYGRHAYKLGLQDGVKLYSELLEYIK